MSKLIHELRRRKVFQVTAIYAVVTWLLIQVVVAVEGPLGLPGWMDTMVIVLLGLGFPVAILLGWAFELTPEGMRRTIAQDPDRIKSGTGAEQVTVHTDRPSIAILPFDNMTNNQEMEFLADGLVEEVTKILAQNTHFFVIARNSAFSYKGQSPDVRLVGRDLGVRYVVEGSLRSVGEKIRVTVQLIDTSSGAHLWSEHFDSETASFLDLHDEVAQKVAAILGDELWATETLKAHQRPTDQLDAWGLYMRVSGIYHGPNTDQAILGDNLDLLRQAIELDPKFALANATYSFALAAMAASRMTADPNHSLDNDEGAETARQHMKTAIEEAPNDPYVLTVCAQTCLELDDVVQASRHAERAFERAPNIARTAYVVARIASRRGESERAIDLCERALRLSPRDASIQNCRYVIAVAETHLGNLEPALAAIDKAIERGQPIFVPRFHLCRANILGLLGRNDEAQIAAKLAGDLSERMTLTWWEAENERLYPAELAAPLSAGLRKASIT